MRHSLRILSLASGPSSALLVLALASCRPGSGTASFSDRASSSGDVDVTPIEATTRRVWAGSDVSFLGSPSPDGRLFVHTGTGELVARDLTSGETRPLAGKSVGSGFAFALSSRVSPDGRSVAFVCSNTAQTYELRVVGTNGRGERTLLRDDDLIDYVVVHGWSPDGSEILALVTTKDGSNRIVGVSANDGAMRTIRSLDWRWPFTLDYSPDGRWLAYDLPATPTSLERDLFVLGLEEKREERLTSGPGDDRLLGWSTHGGGLLFLSDRSGSDAIWRLPLTAGRGRGEPSLVRADAWGVRPIGRTGGALFYGVTIQESRVYTAALDGSGRVTGEPTPVSGLSLGLANSPSWSPDGNHLAYAARSSLAAGGSVQIFVHSLDSGTQREIPGRFGNVRRLAWAPDGRALVLVTSLRGREGFFRVELESGEIRRLAPHLSGPFVPVVPIFSPDGGTLYHYRYEEDTRRLAIGALDLVSGGQRVILPDASNGTAGLSLSPDGRRLAYFSHVEAEERRLAIFVLPVEGGEPVRVHTFAPNESAGQQALTWSPDGRSLLYTAVSGDDASDQRLYRIPAQGGERELLHQGEGVGFVRMRPDGRQIVFTSGRFLGEVWRLEEGGWDVTAAPPGAGGGRGR